MDPDPFPASFLAAFVCLIYHQIARSRHFLRPALVWAGTGIPTPFPLLIELSQAPRLLMSRLKNTSWATPRQAANYQRKQNFGWVNLPAPSKRLPWFFAWIDRVRSWYDPVGWGTGGGNGMGSMPPSNHPQVKFRLLAPKALRWYVTFQYALTLVWLVWMLFQQATFTTPEKVASGALMAWVILNFTLMLRRRKLGYILEYFRLIVVVLYAAFLVQGHHWFREVLFIVSGATFFFLIWLLTLNRIFKR